MTANPKQGDEPGAAGEGSPTGDQSDRPTPDNVIQAIARVMEELPGIGRTERSEQGYDYRGIENITRHAQALLGRYGVVFVPRVIKRRDLALTINNRPWVETQLLVVYKVYGPAHGERVEVSAGRGGRHHVVRDDSITVGPLWGYGRDNSDKGANKAMTQAFKYALLQTFCIGDGKDDPDAGPANEADAAARPPDAERQVRIELRARINALSAADREVVREFCDAASIPRVAAQMDDEQVELVTAKLDAMERERAEAPTGGQAAPQGPSQGALVAGGGQAGDTEEGTPDRAGFGIPAEEVDAIIHDVQSYAPEDVDAQLKDRGLALNGNRDARRHRLAKALVEERVKERGAGPAAPAPADQGAGG